jgi:hypothetical protein
MSAAAPHWAEKTSLDEEDTEGNQRSSYVSSSWVPIRVLRARFAQGGEYDDAEARLGDTGANAELSERTVALFEFLMQWRPPIEEFSAYPRPRDAQFWHRLGDEDDEEKDADFFPLGPRGEELVLQFVSAREERSAALRRTRNEAVSAKAFRGEQARAEREFRAERQLTGYVDASQPSAFSRCVDVGSADTRVMMSSVGDWVASSRLEAASFVQRPHIASDQLGAPVHSPLPFTSIGNPVRFSQRAMLVATDSGPPEIGQPAYLVMSFGGQVGFTWTSEVVLCVLEHDRTLVPLARAENIPTQVLAVAICRDRVAVMSARQAVAVYSVSLTLAGGTGDPYKLPELFRSATLGGPPAAGLGALDFVDKNVLVAASGNQLRVWTLGREQENPLDPLAPTLTFVLPIAAVQCVCPLENHKLLVGGDQGVVVALDWHTGDMGWKMTNHRITNVLRIQVFRDTALLTVTSVDAVSFLTLSLVSLNCSTVARTKIDDPTFGIALASNVAVVMYNDSTYPLEIRDVDQEFEVAATCDIFENQTRALSGGGEGSRGSQSDCDSDSDSESSSDSMGFNLFDDDVRNQRRCIAITAEGVILAVNKHGVAATWAEFVGTKAARKRR